MRGAISVSFEREPDYFRGTQIAGADDQTILAFAQGRLVCIGRCSVRKRYINGAIHRVGYLSDLRLDSAVQGRFDILRRGYQFFHELKDEHPADFYFTSITTDNLRSIQFLERGLPGMPLYERLADFVTLLIPVPRQTRKLKELNKRASFRLKSANIELATGSDYDPGALADFLNSHASRFNLAAAWTGEKISSLRQHNLELSHYVVLRRDGKMIGCAALWDQRPFRQIVIRGYNRRISFFRPLLNLSGKFLGSTRLPSVGSTLAHGFLSPLAVALDDDRGLLSMIEASLLAAANRGMEYVTLGFAAGDPRLVVVRRHFRCREYRNRLFSVRWKNDEFAGIKLDNNLVFPEAALL